MKHIGKLLIGVGAGSLIGLLMPVFMIQVMITMQAILGQLIAFTIPLLIVFFVGEGIATLPNNSGKLLILTLFGAYLSTLVAGIFAYSGSGFNPAVANSADGDFGFRARNQSIFYF